jgi:predicted nucleic acid-binding protein
MAIILDADVLIRAEKEQFDLEAWLRRCGDETVEIAAVTVAEIWHGVFRAEGERQTRRQQFVERVLSRLPVVPGLIQEWSADASSARAESEIKRSRGRGVRAPFPRHS